MLFDSMIGANSVRCDVKHEKARKRYKQSMHNNSNLMKNSINTVITTVSTKNSVFHCVVKTQTKHRTNWKSFADKLLV